VELLRLHNPPFWHLCHAETAYVLLTYFYLVFAGTACFAGALKGDSKRFERESKRF